MRQMTCNRTNVTFLPVASAEDIHTLTPCTQGIWVLRFYCCSRSCIYPVLFTIFSSALVSRVPFFSFFDG